MGRLIAYLSVAIVILALSPRAGAEAPPAPARRAAAPDAPFPFSPQAMWEDMFGKPVADDADLADVEISLEAERAFGQAVLDQYFAKLRSERQKIIQRGRDIDYLRKLVAEIRPLMKNA